MDWIGEALTRLRDHFPAMKPVRGADHALLARLEDRAPGAEELLSFYLVSDGFDVGLCDDVVGQLLPLSKVLKQQRSLRDLGVCDGRLLPVRSDGCGDYDAFVMGAGPCRGAVVFWDHETFERPSHLLGGTFPSYVRLLVDDLVTRYDRSGELRAEYKSRRLDEWPWIAPGELTHPWPHDRDWLRAEDPRAAELLKFPRERGWLADPEE